MSNDKETAEWEELMALVDGEIPAERAEYLKKHLEQCEECRRKVMGVETVSGTLHKWEVPELSTGKANAMLGEIQEGKTSSAGNAALLRRMRMPIMVFGGLALVALFMLSPARMTIPKEQGVAKPATEPYELPAADLSAYSSEQEDKSAAEGWRFSNQSASKATPRLNPRALEALSKTRAELNSAKAVVVTESAPMIARSVELSIVVKDCLAARASVEAILQRHRGYAANLAASSERNHARSLQASLRIPAGELAAAVRELRSMGTLENESQKGEEVTQQHSDLVARLKNSRDTERRLQAILLQRTGKMSDVLEVEQEISRVRGEIEEMEAQQKALEHRVDFATIELRLSEEFHAQLGTPSLSNRLRNAVVSGFQSAADTVMGMLLYCLDYGPSLLLWLAILFFPGRFIWRRLRTYSIKEVM